MKYLLRFYLACLQTATVTFKYAFGGTALLACLYGCNPASGNMSPSTTTSGNADYFNLKQFFEEEISHLANTNTVLQKTATLNAQSETQTLKQVNWKKELSVFTASDINKPAWKGKYTADTIRQNNTLAVTYTATNATLRTQKLQLVFENGNTRPVLVSITNQTNNFVYKTNETLQYQAKNGYNIQASQEVIFMQPETFAISATFVNP